MSKKKKQKTKRGILKVNKCFPKIGGRPAIRMKDFTRLGISWK